MSVAECPFVDARHKKAYKAKKFGGSSMKVRISIGVLFTFLLSSSSAFQKPDIQKTIKLHTPPRPPTLSETKRVQLEDHKGIALNGRVKNSRDLETFLRSYIDMNSSPLGGLRSSDFRLDYINVVPGKLGSADIGYANFIQRFGDLDVDGGLITFTVKILSNKTKVVSARANAYPEARTSGLLSLDQRSAKENVKKHLRSMNVESDLVPMGRKIRFIDGKWRTLEDFAVTARGLCSAVDLETGETFLWDGRVFLDVTGSVNGRGVLFDPLATGTNLNQIPLSDLKVNLAGGSSAFSDFAGNFTLPNSGTTAVGISAELLGSWSDVADQNLTDLTYNGTATPGTPVNILFNPSGSLETDVAQVNGYYHATRVHNWAVSKGANPTGINIPIPTNVNLSSTCNAYYTPGSPSINFYKSGGGCINTAFDTVIYHEYGHFVDDMIGGISYVDGLSEGWGDTLAVYISGQPLIGEGFWGTAGSTVRTADNSYIYNASDEVHTSGQAWAGFNWNLRNNLIASQGAANGIAMAENLVIPVYWANSPDIPSAVREVALRDDPDDDLNNGYPHQAEIIAAANAHGLGYVITPDSTPPTIDIVAPSDGATVAGTVTVNTNATDNVKLVRVEFYIDGTLQYTDTTAPFGWTFSSCNYANGSHSLMAKAFDYAGNSASDTISITIQNDVISPVITAPVSGSTVNNTVPVAATASSCASQVSLYVDNSLVGSDSTTPYSWQWDSNSVSNGAHSMVARAYVNGNPTDSTPVNVTVANTVPVNVATYDSTRMAPRCANSGNSCDSGAYLLNGRGTISGGVESNQPNTLQASCPDGMVGSYHVDESIDRVTISTLDGTLLAPGKSVRVDTKVWAWSISDHLDLYYATDANAPSWTFITTLDPTTSGPQTLTTTYTLPSGPLQAVRARFRYLGTVGPCSASSSYDDHDDLAFPVGLPDTLPPSVVFLSPISGSSVSGTISINVDATDNVGVTTVKFFKDGIPIGEDTTAPYSLSWNTANDPNGYHTLVAQAFDGVGLQNSASSTVTVNNIPPPDNTPPNVAFTYPTNGSSVAGTITVTVNASDNVAVSKVELYKDNVLFGTDTTSPYSFSWNTTGTANGAHSLKAIAYDTANLTGSQTITVTVNNNFPPTVSLSASPTSGKAPLRVNFTASASDPNSDPLTYDWVFGDGSIKNNGGSLQTHTYYKGTFSACVTVRDGRGGVASSCKTITVTGRPGFNATGTSSINSLSSSSSCAPIDFTLVDMTSGALEELDPEILSTTTIQMDGKEIAGGMVSICLAQGELHTICAYPNAEIDDCWTFKMTNAELALEKGDPSRFLLDESTSLKSENSTSAGGCKATSGRGFLFFALGMLFLLIRRSRLSLSK